MKLYFYILSLVFFMEKHVVLSLRLGLRLFHGVAFLYGFYFFSEVLNIVEMFQFHWFLPFAALACMTFIFFSACSIYVVTKDGIRWQLMFGPALSPSKRRKFTPWNYEILQVRGVFPFYYMFAFLRQDNPYPYGGDYDLSPDNIPYRRSIAFFFCRNFLDLIIFIDENIPYEKMKPEYRDRIWQLADKYRRLKKNHQIIYWILNNV